MENAGIMYNDPQFLEGRQPYISFIEESNVVTKLKHPSSFDISAIGLLFILIFIK